MAHQDPGTGRATLPTAEPVGEPVWRRRLPWQRWSPGDAGEPGGGSATDPGPPARRPEPADDGLADDGDHPVPDGSADSRPDLTRHLLAGAVGLSLLLLLLPALLLDDTDHTRPRAAEPTGDFVLDVPAPPTAPETASTPGTGPGVTPSPRVTVAPAPRHTAAPETVPVRLTSPLAPTPSPTPVPSRPVTSGTVIRGTSVLERGQAWRAGRTVLVLQGDGNLVLYDRQGHPRWQSGTVGQGATAVFQADGNFVVYTSSMHPVWSSRTDGQDGAELLLGADGNLTIRHGAAVLWSARSAE